MSQLGIITYISLKLIGANLNFPSQLQQTSANTFSALCQSDTWFGFMVLEVFFF